VRKKDLAIFRFLKRFFPTTPDWLLGGLLLMLLLWLVVLPAEFLELTLRQQSIDTGFWGWSIKLLYFWGYTIALFSIGSVEYYSSASDQLIEIFIVLFGLIITTPIYVTVHRWKQSYYNVVI
jgi:hypothetical protein